jgi:hypothetical protein
MEGNQIGFEIKEDMKDYSHFIFVDEASDSSDYSSIKINQSQFKTFIKFKKACISEKLIQNFDYFDDYYLLRFCHARNFDYEKTLKMFKKFIKWRIENDVDNIDTYNFTELDEVLKAYPHGFHKIDKNGNPIYYQLISKLNTEKLFKISSTERLLRYFIQTSEYMMKIRYPACSKLKGELIVGSCIIIDMEGIGISDLLGKILSFFKLAASIGQDYYPGNMAKTFLLNTNRFFGLIYNLIKGLIDIKTRQKFEILGRDYKEKVYEFIDPENLPTFLGGTCTCPKVPGGCLYCDIGPWNPEGKIIKCRNKNEDSFYKVDN